jgi:hypothetical protein
MRPLARGGEHRREQMRRGPDAVETDAARADVAGTDAAPVCRTRGLLPRRRAEPEEAQVEGPSLDVARALLARSRVRQPGCLLPRSI